MIPPVGHCTVLWITVYGLLFPYKTLEQGEYRYSKSELFWFRARTDDTYVLIQLLQFIVFISVVFKTWFMDEVAIAES